MNEPTRSELEWVKQRHARLEEEIALLSRQLQMIEARIRATEPSDAPPPAVAAAPTGSVAPNPATPPPLPPVIRQWRIASVPDEPPPPPPPVREEKLLRCACMHCGGAIEFAAVQVGDTAPCPHCGESTFLTMETRPPIEPQRPTAVAPPPKPPVFARPQTADTKERSFEMRLGTYWLVRIGIVMLLTGLVFFGNYAYQNFIVRIGPIGKVTLLYAASGLLLAAGTWWQRKAATQALRNYAQVLFAGGRWSRRSEASTSRAPRTRCPPRSARSRPAS
jgi:uncharacterized membrane protein